jgi:hypothetical protein
MSIKTKLLFGLLAFSFLLFSTGSLHACWDCDTYKFYDANLATDACDSSNTGSHSSGTWDWTVTASTTGLNVYAEMETTDKDPDQTLGSATREAQSWKKIRCYDDEGSVDEATFTLNWTGSCTSRIADAQTDEHYGSGGGNDHYAYAEEQAKILVSSNRIKDEDGTDRWQCASEKGAKCPSNPAGANDMAYSKQANAECAVEVNLPPIATISFNLGASWEWDNATGSRSVSGEEISESTSPGTASVSIDLDEEPVYAKVYHEVNTYLWFGGDSSSGDDDDAYAHASVRARTTEFELDVVD